MKKKYAILDDEIDLIASFKIIWDGKIKILLITIISFLVGFGYNFQIPRNYLNSLNINVSHANEFTRLDNLREFLRTNQSIQSKKLNQSNIIYQVDFINELRDYKEFLLIIKNTKKIQERLLKLKIENVDKEIELSKYAKLFEIVAPRRDNENYIIKFKWDDPSEAKKILQDTLNLVSKNLKRLTDLELSQSLEFKKKILLNKDKVRLSYLKEQSAIAKELNIEDNQIQDISLRESGLSLNINTADVAYYLRGYRAIDKEIELIQDREYQNIKFIEKELNYFTKENVKWVKYNIDLMNIKSLKDTKLILIVSILLGLIVGILYVLISNAFKSKKNSKKSN